jgi:hypothetical protein
MQKRARRPALGRLRAQFFTKMWRSGWVLR